MPTLRIFGISALCATLPCLAGSFAHISDPDGYVNLRSAPSNKAEIVQTTPQGSCVETFAQQGPWTQVALLAENATVTGYIRSSRLVPDESCARVKSVAQRLGACAEARIRSETLANLLDLKRWREQNPACQSTEQLEALSDFLTHYLSRNWREAQRELSGLQDDQSLRKFLLERLAQAHSRHQLQNIATQSCTPGASLCQELQRTVQQSLEARPHR